MSASDDMELYDLRVTVDSISGRPVCGLATSRVRLGAACLNPYTQHPYEIAGGLPALDAASGGLPTSAWPAGRGSRRSASSSGARVDHLRDTAAIVRALLSGDEHGYAGAA